jgi:nucleotide-binding universal stress UspA family protein
MNATNTASVIVGIDGSEQALEAVRAAAREAYHRSEPLHIVHAFIWPALHVNVGPVAGDLPETGLRHHAEDLLKEAATEAGKAAPQVPVTTALIDGAATPVLLEESHRATLLVLGDRGLDGISGLLIGSTAVHAVAHARCPVLVIRGAEPTAGPVVVGVDGSEASTLAVGFAFEESAYRGAELIPVLAWNDSTPDGSREGYTPGYLAASIEQAARRALSESLAGWQERYPDIVVRPELVHGHPRHVLVERSKTAQLVVLGARGRDTFKGLLLGSISQALLCHSACPVAVVRATLSPHRPIDPPPGMRTNSTSQPLDNVDQFIDRPVNAVSGLVPSRQRVDEVLDALRAAGADVSDVVVRHGPDGVRILDTDGTQHGARARFVRFFQNWGYDDAVLNLYDEGLRRGESAVTIPSAPENKVALARLLQQHQGHAIYYFGVTRAESLSGP